MQDEQIINAEKQIDDYIEPIINVLLQPEEKQFEMPRAKTAAQLLQALDLRPETALVIRDGQLLTPDRRIYSGESLTVRKVVSSG